MAKTRRLPELPSRPSLWTPRHEDIAQVRDVEAHENNGETAIAAVEVGGVYQSLDGGASWTERSGAVHRDVHEAHAVDSEEYLAATGFGVFRTTDGGQSWDRPDETVDREYAKALEHGGRIYTSATDGPHRPGERTHRGRFYWNQSVGPNSK